ncbi:serine hydrolase [Caldicellulosiruptor danielii]|uniref:Serine hydrolase n=1 Tax=Anaerocellum danielii TaxID=1387557 RepID=A0ABZ0TXW2_9FIRM|nr:serine hydrolase [Caldicellulosiruptor danielii]WPX08303.1 serine hydrolase [Caldicellulosiruptor danielii]
MQIEKTKNPILIKHLFTMTMGLPYAHPFRESPTAIEMKKVREELIKNYGKYDIVTEAKAMAKVPLEFEPGTRWLYGYGHDVVAALIQIISGKKVSEFLKEEIFEPLGMNDTGYRYFGDIEERMVTCYKRNEDGTLEKTRGIFDEFHQPDSLYEGGGAGLFSTVRDYIKFSQMLANGGVYKGKRIIGRKTIDLMRTNQLDKRQLLDFNKNNVYLAGYGYGLGVRTLISTAEGNFNSSTGEFGWTGALGTYVSIDPSEGFSLVYMHQMIPNMEQYYHLRVRTVAYGCL